MNDKEKGHAMTDEELAMLRQALDGRGGAENLTLVGRALVYSANAEAFDVLQKIAGMT